MADEATTVERATGVTFLPAFFLHVQTAVPGEGPTKFSIDDETVKIDISNRKYTTTTNDPTVDIEFHKELTVVVTRTESRLEVTLASDT